MVFPRITYPFLRVRIANHGARLSGIRRRRHTRHCVANRKRLSPVARRKGQGSKESLMAVAVIDLRVQPFRLLTKAQAAHYCSLRDKKFDAHCPVRPIRMANGELRWDVQDLDRWIDNLKDGTAAGCDADRIVERLG